MSAAQRENLEWNKLQTIDLPFVEKGSCKANQNGFKGALQGFNVALVGDSQESD